RPDDRGELARPDRHGHRPERGHRRRSGMLLGHPDELESTHWATTTLVPATMPAPLTWTCPEANRPAVTATSRCTPDGPTTSSPYPPPASASRAWTGTPTPFPVPPRGVTVSWAGPAALIVPDTVACDGRTIETRSPTVVGGRFGFTGTVTVRWPVVTWYGRCPAAA